MLPIRSLILISIPIYLPYAYKKGRSHLIVVAALAGSEKSQWTKALLQMRSLIRICLHAPAVGLFAIHIYLVWYIFSEILFIFARGVRIKSDEEGERAWDIGQIVAMPV